MKVTYALLTLALIGSVNAHATASTGDVQPPANCQAALNGTISTLSPVQVDAQYNMIDHKSAKTPAKVQSADASKATR
jgi:hypothetical protein